MKPKSLTKFVCFFLMFAINLAVVAPSLSFPKRASAEFDSSDEEIDAVNQPDMTQYPDGDGAETDGLTEAEYQAISAEQEKTYDSVVHIGQTLGKYMSIENDSSAISVDEVLTTTQNAKLIVTASDLQAVRSLQCMANVIPPYEEDMIALYRDLPIKDRADVDKVVKLESQKAQEYQKFTSPTEYLFYLKTGSKTDGTDETAPDLLYKNHQYFLALVESAQNRIDNDKLKAIWEAEADNIRKSGTTTTSVSTLSCVTRIDENEITDDLLSDQGREYLADAIDDGDGGGVLNDSMVDIRVIKTLVYLVTPKNQGGAGHWRVKVKRILQRQDLSTESDSTILTLAGNQQTPGSSNVQCDPSMTAAQCGQVRGTAPDAEVQDQGGDQYDAYLQDLTDQEDNYLADNRNVSAHFSGQAVDITEIDDIRCTMVKKRRLGKDTRIPKPIQPIKLAWQTTDGFNKSGGASQFDTMSMLKDLAKESMVDLLSSFNQDISDYDGDLSQAGLDDIIGILGQSMLGYVLNTPGSSIKGYDAKGTLRNLGGSYLADYLGLPRSIFVGHDLGDLDETKYLIGRAAIEKRLSLPYGSLNYLNGLKTSDQEKPVYDLEGLLLNIGQSKIEYEMNLRSGDLNGFVRDGLNGGGTETNLLIGSRAIENALNLPQYSWPAEPTSFAEMTNYYSSVKLNVFGLEPSLIDSMLNIGTDITAQNGQPTTTNYGTTLKFVEGQINSSDFASYVGKIRMANTSSGLQYFAMNNSGYQMPGPTKDHPEIQDTWKDAMSGDKNALETIGIYTLARLFTDSSLSIATNDKLGEGESLTKITYLETYKTNLGTEVAIEKDYKREEFSQHLFREWLKANLLKSPNEACESARSQEEIDATIKISNSGTFHEQVSTQKAVICPLDQNLNFKLYYRDKNGAALTKYANAVYDIPSARATSIGLENFDLYKMLSYSTADGRTVFTRIGAKLLYYGIANKLLSKEEQTKIDLMDADPSLNISNDELGFYLQRIVKSGELSQKIKDDWTAINKDRETYPELDVILTNIDSLLNKLQRVVNENDADITKVKSIIAACRDVVDILKNLNQQLTKFKEYLTLNGKSTADTRIAQINALIVDVNELVRVTSEIFAGKPISSSDLINISQISPLALNQLSSNNNGDGRRNGNKGLSNIQIAGLIFDFLSGKITITELIMRIGASKAESSLGLPSNSLLYLVQNYEDRGITGQDALFQAIGQARIEENFNMPAFYFQGATLDNTPPDFANNPEALLLWAGPEIYTYYSLMLRMKPVPGFKMPSIFMLRSVNPSIYSKLVVSAKARWQQAYKEALDAQGGNIIKESNLADIVQNIKNRKFGDGIRTPENDLLFRMGFPTGQYNGLTQDLYGAWSTGDSYAKKIDKAFSINNGSTRTLFTGNDVLNSTNLSSKEKDLLETSDLKIGKNILEKYIQALNRQLLPEELAKYDPRVMADYIYVNPYAKPKTAADTCPIIYTPKDGFLVNEDTIENNSYCYYDKIGRHCFQSKAEAERYAAAHPQDQITDILSLIALRFSQVYDSAFPSGSVGTEEIYRGFVDFLNNPNKKTVFTDNALEISRRNTGESSTDESKVADSVFKTIAQKTTIPYDLLSKLFSRGSLNSPVTTYKRMVGEKEAGKILSTRIFDELNLDINPRIFDAGDFYDILTGDFSSLYRLGTSYIDNELSLPPGTTLVVITAFDKDARNCALDQVGGTLLGSLVGLDYVPLKGNLSDFVANIGESKIEQTLNLPRGSFRGANMDELIQNIGPINFALTFKIPVEDWIPVQAEKDILGDAEYNRIKNTSQFYQLTVIRDHLLTLPGVNTKAYNAINEINFYLTGAINFVLGVISGPAADSTTLQIAVDKTSPPGFLNWHQQVAQFYQQIYALDTALSIEKYSTFFLLTDLATLPTAMTPNKYAETVGNVLIGRIAVMQIANLLDINTEAAGTALNVINDIQAIFACTKSTVRDGQCFNPSMGGNDYDSRYHKWAMLYQDLDKLFDFKLDDKAGLPTGTIAHIIDRPDDAFSILIGVGAQKLDLQMGLNSGTALSFTALYRAIYPDEEAANEQACRDQAFPDNLDQQLDLQLARNNRDLENAQKGTQAYSDALTARNLTIQQINEHSDLYQQCKINKRDQQNTTVAQGNTAIPADWKDRVWEWAQDAIATQVQRTIAGMTVKGNCRTVTTPTIAGPTQRTICDDVPIGVTDIPLQDIRNLMSGDLRYLSAIGLAMTANYAMVLLDNMNNYSCPDQELDSSSHECRVPIPAGMRITYEDISMAIFGPDMDNFTDTAAYLAQQGATFQFDDDSVSHGLPEGTGDTFEETMNHIINGNVPADGLSASGRVNRDMEEGYGVPSDFNGKQVLNQWKSDYDGANDVCVPQFGVFGDGYEGCMRQQFSAKYGDDPVNWPLANMQRYNENMQGTSSSGNNVLREKAKDIATKKLEYKIVDIALWKIDTNIFPGFAEAMLGGTTQQRWEALGRYIGNGLRSHRLLGVNFDLGNIPDIEMWGKVLIFADQQFIDHNPDAFGNFIGNGGFELLSDYIGKNSEDWFGFKIDSSVAQGLVTGLATGDWGLNEALSLDGVLGGTAAHSMTVGDKAVTVPTLGSALVGIATSRIFAWADKIIGLPPGTSYKIAQMSYKTYKAYTAYKDAKRTWEAAKTAANEKLMLDAKQVYRVAISAVVQFAIDILVQKLLGDEIGQVEDSLGLVPGSLSPVVSAGAYSLLASSSLGQAWGLQAIGPTGWMIIAAVFILTNLFGVYKVEYWCTADGYYPKIGGPSSQNDISNLGTWGGNVKDKNLNKVLQGNSIKAAQYKARRLIGDMLNIQNNKKFNDSNGLPLIPIQIMTGRKEDVDYWNNLISTNICAAEMGKGTVAIEGICSSDGETGDTRLGVWQNPQAVVWTHIGF